jgi:hypothetical protein
LDSNLKGKIEHEVLRINKLFNSASPLLNLCGIKEADFVEASAAGSFLQSFYNGIESIVLLIFKTIGESIPNDFHWHKKLLENTFVANERRTIIFRNDYKEKLFEYLSFRHYFRHSYGFEIDLNRLTPLINGVKEFWKELENDINKFVENN